MPLSSDSLHDLISPVNQIGIIAELLLKKYGTRLDQEAESLYGLILNAASRLQSMVAGLTTYRQVLGSQRPGCQCNANALLAGAKTYVQTDIEQNDAVVTHDRLPELYCDPDQISYAFASLVENSIKFRSEHRPEIHVSATAEENMWVFSVRDNGIGIDTRYADRIFGLFKRIHNEGYPGAGVGLTITRQIVERHGGRIWVESQLGLGATVFFSLPR